MNRALLLIPTNRPTARALRTRAYALLQLWVCESRWHEVSWSVATPLGPRYLNYVFVYPPSFAFCGQYGTALAGQTPASVPSPPILGIEDGRGTQEQSRLCPMVDIPAFDPGGPARHNRELIGSPPASPLRRDCLRGCTRDHELSHSAAPQWDACHELGPDAGRKMSLS